MKSWLRRGGFAVLLGLSVGACVPAGKFPTVPETAHAPAMMPRISDRLYFGRGIPQGGAISEEAWSDFLAVVVTPRFPDGFTVWRAEGQWREAAGGIAKEPSFVLEVIHPDDSRLDRAIGEIIAEYRRRFSQESVLHVRDRVEAGF